MAPFSLQPGVLGECKMDKATFGVVFQAAKCFRVLPLAMTNEDFISKPALQRPLGCGWSCSTSQRCVFLLLKKGCFPSLSHIPHLPYSSPTSPKSGEGCLSAATMFPQLVVKHQLYFVWQSRCNCSLSTSSPPQCTFPSRLQAIALSHAHVAGWGVLC